MTPQKDLTNPTDHSIPPTTTVVPHPAEGDASPLSPPPAGAPGNGYVGTPIMLTPPDAGAPGNGYVGTPIMLTPPGAGLIDQTEPSTQPASPTVPVPEPNGAESGTGSINGYVGTPIMLITPGSEGITSVTVVLSNDPIAVKSGQIYLNYYKGEAFLTTECANLPTTPSDQVTVDKLIPTADNVECIIDGYIDNYYYHIQAYSTPPGSKTPA